MKCLMVTCTKLFVSMKTILENSIYHLKYRSLLWKNPFIFKMFVIYYYQRILKDSLRNRHPKGDEGIVTRRVTKELSPEEEKEEGATAATAKAFKGHAVCHPKSDELSPERLVRSTSPKKALRGF